jgi:hypothetical protein
MLLTQLIRNKYIVSTFDLFNDAVIVSDSVATNWCDNQLIINWNDCGESMCEKSLGQPVIPNFLGGTEENVEEVQHSQTSDRVLNAGLLEHGALAVR